MPLKAVYWVSQATGLRLGKILSTSRTFNLFCWLHDVVVFYPLIVKFYFPLFLDIIIIINYKCLYFAR